MDQRSDLRDKLVTYIQDAYAMENQIVDVLEQHVQDAANYPDIQAAIQQHLEETKQHRQRMEACLSAYNEKPSAVKGAAASLMGNLKGAVSGGRSDTLAKNARDEYTTEHMEIATYGLLIAIAHEAGDTATVRACELNLNDEVRMAHTLEQQMPRFAVLTLQEDNISVPLTAFQETDTEWQQALQAAHQTYKGQIPGVYGATGTAAAPPTA